MNDAGEQGKFKLYVTVDGIFIKKIRARYNQFGRHVGTDQLVYTIHSIVNKLKEKEKKATISNLISIIESVKQELQKTQT